MIGRAALSNPWIFRQVMEPGLEVSEVERIDLCIAFFGMLLELLEPREAMHKMKKIGSWFTKGLPGGVHFRQGLQQCNDHATIVAELEKLKTYRGD
jgi:tRNA-dihydrouridine synthase